MRVLSLFDGISCGHVALDRAGIPVEVYYASEIDKYAIQITQKNYPNTIQLGDVTKIDFKEFIGKVDLVMGGSPCQDLSIAGKRAGLSGDRSGLFYKFVEAIETIKPKYFLLENNVGMPQDAYEGISRLMGCYPIEINSALVSAQTRKRYYWTNIGPQNYNLFGFPTVAIPQPENKGILLKDVLESGYAPDDKSRCIQSSIGRTTTREYFKKNQGQMVVEPIIYNRYNEQTQKGKSFTITSNTGNVTAIGGQEVVLKIPGNTVKGYAEIEQGECMDLTHLNSKTHRGRAMIDKCNCLQTQSEFYQYIKPCALRNRGNGKEPEFNNTDKANALTSVQTDSMDLEPLRLKQFEKSQCQSQRVYSVRGKSVVLNANGGSQGAKTGLYKIDLPDGEYLIRKLTPLECERLQTLPDGYTELGKSYYCQNIYDIINMTIKGEQQCKNVKLKDVTTQYQTEKQDYAINIICDLLDMERQNLQEIQLKEKKNVLLRDVITYNKQEKDIVLNTIKDLKEQEALNCKKMNQKNVNIAIEWQLQEECVISIIKIGYDTEMHNIQIKLEKEQINTDIKNLKESIECSIEKLLPKYSEGILHLKKLYTILIWINLIIIKKIYMCVIKTNTQAYINSLIKLQENLLSVELSNLKMANIIPISATQRYKAIGNGWTVDVIAHIFSYMEEVI